ncbi:hypothetical protein EVAR_70988_1 [Eumeta japonica]|uniref:Uncharacterized protein n=1 Tax=Eumeta variegata TaxID=151549 RepID=A0A4C1SU17_EUMVA|nr:hypothetical protein EVAR_70988_1 [Eumeta japonica]
MLALQKHRDMLTPNAEEEENEDDSEEDSDSKKANKQQNQPIQPESNNALPANSAALAQDAKSLQNIVSPTSAQNNNSPLTSQQSFSQSSNIQQQASQETDQQNLHTQKAILDSQNQPQYVNETQQLSKSDTVEEINQNYSASTNDTNNETKEGNKANNPNAGMPPVGRKISRFYVNPVLLSPSTDVSTNTTSVATTMEGMQQENVKPNSDVKPEKLPTNRNETTTSATNPSNNAVDSLEQLKIELENITHAQAIASAIVASINNENSNLQQSQPQSNTQQLYLNQDDKLILDASCTSLGQNTPSAPLGSTRTSTTYNSRRTSLDKSMSNDEDIPTPTIDKECDFLENNKETSNVSTKPAIATGSPPSIKNNVNQPQGDFAQSSIVDLGNKLAA